MSDAIQRDVFVKIIKKASKEGVKSGFIKSEIRENVADGLADQYAFTYEILAKGYKITPEKLAVALIEKGIGIAKMGSSHEQYQCGISAALVGVGFFKAFRSAAAAAVTEGAATPLLICETADLIDKIYKMDKKCGISDAVEKKVLEKTTPAYMWFEEGITKWIGSQAFI